MLTRTRTKHFSFHTGTKGLLEHKKFIEEVDNKNWKIVHAYTILHKYTPYSPESLNYIVQYKESIFKRSK